MPIVQEQAQRFRIAFVDSVNNAAKGSWKNVSGGIGLCR